MLELPGVFSAALSLLVKRIVLHAHLFKLLHYSLLRCLMLGCLLHLLSLCRWQSLLLLLLLLLLCRWLWLQLALQRSWRLQPAMQQRAPCTQRRYVPLGALGAVASTSRTHLRDSTHGSICTRHAPCRPPCWGRPSSSSVTSSEPARKAPTRCSPERMGRRRSAPTIEACSLWWYILPKFCCATELWRADGR